MNIMFRADSSSVIGTGHIMRDLVLANQYQNDNIIFAVQELQGNINKKILKNGYPIKILHSNDIKELNKLIQKCKVDLLIIDHYGIDYKFEKEIKKQNTNIKILSFDDTYEEHYCDILLNHNLSANETKYENLVPKECELRCGSKYTLIRDEFIVEKNKDKQKNEKYTFFLALGGADYENISFKILKILEKFKNIIVNIVTTTANPNVDKLNFYAKKNKFVKLHINSNKLGEIMKQSDFAIVAPSVILHEVIYMELPFVAVKIAENQDDMYKYLKNNDYKVVKKGEMKKLKVILKKTISN